ncbi:MAG TPA: antibiotic biosynthesis monooxygenase [Xanthobacteraceae bacterium]|nr:antibiotic biosynthesis monooxygenase [Xanthobacteraceae bacterium]
MFVVIFEVQPKKERRDDYLNLAKFLKPELEKIDGFIDNERFDSTRTEGRVLSLSTWRDEKAIIRWRTLALHHEVQEKGRFEIFEDYHLRVAEVTIDSQVPANQKLKEQRFDLTEVGRAKIFSISEWTPSGTQRLSGADFCSSLNLPMPKTGISDHEIFESIYNPGKLLLFISWNSTDAAEAWRPQLTGTDAFRHRCARVIRDYGMRDRREAPQYYPGVDEENERRPQIHTTDN